MKNAIVCSLLLLLFATNASAQYPSRCNCIQRFANDLELMDTNQVVNELSDAVLDRFKRLKREDEKFRLCSDYYTLAFNLWTLGKLRIVQGLGQCELSEKVKAIIESGPLIYEMDFALESKIEEEHKAMNYEENRDSAVLKKLGAKAKDYLDAFFKIDSTEYLRSTIKKYVDFHTEETILSQFVFIERLQKEKAMHVLNINVTPPEYLIQVENNLSTLIEVDYTLSTDDSEKTLNGQLLAMSKDEGANWKFIDIINEELISLWVVVDDLYPIALESKLAKEKAKKINADSPEGLADMYCNCMEQIEVDSFENLMNCINKVKESPYFKSKKDRKKVHQHVFENCLGNSGSLLMFSPKDED